MISSTFLLKIAGLTIIGLAGYKLSEHTNIFEIPIYLGIGILFGHLLRLDPLAHPELMEGFLHISVGLILFYGGYELSVEYLRKNLKPIVVLSTLGIVLTAVIIGYATSFLLGWTLVYGLLFGSLISAIDPATLIPLFDQYSIKKEIETLLVSESGYNDATAAVLTATVLSVITTGNFSAMSVLSKFLYDVLVGIGLGALIGLGESFVLRKVKPNYVFLGFLLILGILGSYAIPHQIGGSGFMGAITAGLFLKLGQVKIDPRLDYEKSGKMFSLLHESSVLGRIWVFVLLGGFVEVSAFQAIGLSGIVIVGILMFISRPVTVLVGLFVGRLPNPARDWDWREIGILSWAGDVRGAVPATLAGIIMVRGITHGHHIVGLTFLAVLLTIGIQATTTPFLIRKLGLD